MKPIIQLDFDGVVHSYVSGWKGETDILDPPVKGAFEAIQNYIENGFKVCIVSSRCKTYDGMNAVLYWFEDNSFLYCHNDNFDISQFKQPAIINIDDRSWPKWDGVFPTVEEIKNFKPWYK